MRHAEFDKILGRSWDTTTSNHNDTDAQKTLPSINFDQIREKIEKIKTRVPLSQDPLIQSMPGMVQWARLIEFWEKPDFHDDTYIAGADYDVLNNAGMIIRAPQYQQAATSTDVITQAVVAKKVHADIPPEPYIGNMMEGRVFIIDMRPPCGTFDDEYNDKTGWGWGPLARVAAHNLIQDEQNAHAMYYMDPKLGETPGGKYWCTSETSKLGEYTKELVNKAHPGETTRALQLFSDHVCVLNICAYHSVGWMGLERVVPEMRSSQLMLDFIAEYVITRALNDEMAAVVLCPSDMLGRMLGDRRFKYNGGEYTLAELGNMKITNLYLSPTGYADRLAPASWPAGAILRGIEIGMRIVREYIDSHQESDE